MRHLFAAALIAFVLSLLCVHYLEESLLPGVVRVRAALLGEQKYMAALEGCAGLKNNVGWVHPATLSLTVYDKVQEKLVAHFGEHRPEVLPGYARVHSADGDLRCVADYLLTVSPPENVGGLQVRAMRYDTEKQLYGLRPGWVSGLAQGFAGQVFLAAFVEHGDKRYLEAAVQAGNLLRVPINAGGVLVELSSGDIWFEEYAQAGQEPPLILNGHLLALDFLYWMARADLRGPWAALFDAGTRSAAARIGTYSGRLWSYYDANHHLANHKYHKFHIRQLERYAQHDPTGHLHAAHARMQWQKWVPLGVMQRFFTQPSRLLIFLVGVFTALFFVPVMLCSRRVQARRKSPA